MIKQNEKKSTRSQQGKGLSALWLSFVAFAFGYLAASWFDINQVVNFVIKLTQPNAPQQVVVKEPEAVLPAPKLEFYTLLTDEKQPSALAKAEPDILKKTISKKYEDAKPVDESQPLDLEVTSASPSASIEPQPVKLKPVEVTKPVLRNLPKTPVLATSEGYSIQVGSFRALQEAQRMKTKMEMKGSRVEIVSVAQQDIRWYRVMIGPFTTLGQARQAQQDFARREHINGMIRRVG
jgi:cell division protein FtsN